MGCKFSVGDSVTVKTNFAKFIKGGHSMYVNEHLELGGKCGTVVHIKETDEYWIGVQFDYWNDNFHSLNGYAEPNFGYYLHENMLEKHNDYKVDLL